MTNHFWVIEYDGVPQLGEAERYYAIEKAEENFGSVLDKNGQTWRLVRYGPVNSSLVPPVDREAALRSEGVEP